MKGLKWWLAGLTVACAALSVVPAAMPARAQSGAEGTAGAVDAVKSRVEALDEQLSTVQSDLGKLKKFKFSGYVQARYELNEQSRRDTVAVSGSSVTPANLNRFYIRRGRVKLTYDSGPLSQAVVYFDGGEDRAITLLEAYVTLKDPWTSNHRHALAIGQMNVPFGYEIERSSSVRELPERSRAENVLFKGERDRGATFTSQWLPQLQTVVGVLNGPGIKHSDFPNSTPRKGKDFVGRARWSQGVFDVAGSVYSGKNVIPLVEGGRDRSHTHDKTRYGADAQGYYLVPMLGGGSLKGEFYQGHEVNPDSVKKLTSSRVLGAGKRADHLATDFSGWYAQCVQNVGEKLQVAARYDVFDPNTDVDHDQYKRFGAALNYFFDGNVRVTMAYDVPKTERRHPVTKEWYDPKDNLWTFQFQHKF